MFTIPNFGAIGNLVAGLLGRKPKQQEEFTQREPINILVDVDNPLQALKAAAEAGVDLTDKAWNDSNLGGIRIGSNTTLVYDNRQNILVRFNYVGRQFSPEAAHALANQVSGLAIRRDSIRYEQGMSCPHKYISNRNGEWIELN